MLVQIVLNRDQHFFALAELSWVKLLMLIENYAYTVYAFRE